MATTPTVRASATPAAAIAGTSLSINKPTGTVNGDLMVAIAITGGPNEGTLAGLTAPAGWTLLGSGASAVGYGNIKAWSRVAASEGASYSFGFDGTDCLLSMHTITTGTYDTTTPIPAAAVAYTADTTASSTKTAPSVTGINQGLLVSGYCDVGTATGTPTFTVGGSQTELVDFNAGASGHTGLDVASLVLAANGATTAQTATSSSSRRSLTVSIAISPASATGTNYTWNQTDTLNPTDSVTVQQGRGPTDPVTMTDTVTVRMDVGRQPVDVLAMSDTVTVTYLRADITDYQFVMADKTSDAAWLPFGPGTTLNVSKFDSGSADTRDQDVNAVRGDYRVFGTDYKSPPTWGWEMWTDCQNPADALLWVDKLKAVWDAKSTRMTPGAVLSLRYAVGGRVRRVYGRPRRFTPVPDKIQLGVIHVVADFALAEDVYYDDTENTTTVAMTPTTISGSGIHVPSKIPWVFSATPVPRTEQMVIGGTRSTWVDVTFVGPVTNPWVQIGSLTWGLNGNIPIGRTMTLSGKPWQVGIFDQAGLHYPGMLDPRARLSALQMDPGIYSVNYGGADNTGSSRVILSRRNANQYM